MAGIARSAGHRRLTCAFQTWTPANASRTSCTVAHVPRIHEPKWMRSTAGRAPPAGGSVGRSVSGSQSVPIERPASLSPSHAAQSKPKASMAT